MTINWLHTLPPQRGDDAIVITQKLRGVLAAVFDEDDVHMLAGTQPSKLLPKMRWATDLCADEIGFCPSREQLIELAAWVTNYLGELLTAEQHPPSDSVLAEFAVAHGLHALVKAPESKQRVLRGEVLLADHRTSLPLNPVWVRLAVLRIDG